MAQAIGPQLEDIKDALHDVKQDTKQISEALNTHLIAYSGSKAATEAEVNGLGKRLNDHIDAGKRFWPIWTGVIAAAIIGAGKALFDLIRNGGKP